MRKSTYSTSSTSSSKVWMKWAGVIFIFGSFIALIAYAAMHKDTLMKDESDLELILPSAGPVKVRAENPGGMEVNNRDKEVFNLLDNSAFSGEIQKEDLCETEESATLCNQKLPKVTALAADPRAAKQVEQNLKMKPKSADIALLIENYDPVSDSAVVESSVNVDKKEVEVEVVKPVQYVAQATVEKEKVEQKTEKEVVIDEDASIKLSPKNKMFTEGSWGVQLASYRKLSGADAGAEIFLKKYPDILKQLTYVTEKIEIPNKGVFYRVQFIGLKDKTDAKKACDSLKGAGASGCWYVSK